MTQQLADQKKTCEKTETEIREVHKMISAYTWRLTIENHNYRNNFCHHKTSRMVVDNKNLFGPNACYHWVVFLYARELPAIVATCRSAVKGVRQTKSHFQLNIAEVPPRRRFQYCCYIMRLKPLVRDLKITIGRKEDVVLEKILSVIGKSLIRLRFERYNMDYYPACYPPVSNHV